jgi:hypothetical protein
MITLNKFAESCLERFRQHFHIKPTAGTKKYSVMISAEWRRMDEALDKARDESSALQKHKYMADAKERLVDIVVYCVGFLRLLGVKDVEEIIQRRLGK